MTRTPNYFIEGVVNISHADGVFRITFGQRSGETEYKEEVCLFLPASQMGNILQTLASGTREIGSKIQEKMGTPAVTGKRTAGSGVRNPPRAKKAAPRAKKAAPRAKKAAPRAKK